MKPKFLHASSHYLFNPIRLSGGHRMVYKQQGILTRMVDAKTYENVFGKKVEIVDTKVNVCEYLAREVKEG
jgi:hypothetical protein